MFNKLKSIRTIQTSQPHQRGSNAGRPRKVVKTVNATLLNNSDKGVL